MPDTISPKAMTASSPLPSPELADLPTSPGIFRESFSFNQPDVFDEVSDSLAPMRAPIPFRGRAIDYTPGPIPPSLRQRLSVPTPSARPTINLASVTGALPDSPGRMTRAPSPLPPVLETALPTEIHEMLARLSQLVTQSNEYVRGLSARIDAIEKQRVSLEGPASIESLKIFLEASPAYSSLDAERVASFGLPLYVWQHISERIQADHTGSDKGLASILFWRARAEAEAMGLLNNDRRPSLTGESTWLAGKGSVSDGAQSIFLPESRRQSSGSDLGPPRRPSMLGNRSYRSGGSGSSQGDGRRPSYGA